MWAPAEQENAQIGARLSMSKSDQRHERPIMEDDEVTTAPTVAHTGFFPVVIGTDVRVEQAGGAVFVSKGDLSLSQAGAQAILAGGDVSIQQGGVKTILAKGDVSITEGGALLAAGREVQVRGGWVAVALGLRVDLSNSKVLIGPKQAAVFGAVAGLVAVLLRGLMGRSDTVE